MKRSHDDRTRAGKKGLPVAARERENLLSELSQDRLPANYEAAKRAISECLAVDECKSFRDKAAAIAMYAQQADDPTLLLGATRIKGYAWWRCGELLKQVPSGQGSKSQHGELRQGALTRQQVARNAGLSRGQMATALQVANIAKVQSEALMESDPPPTVTQLAKLGREFAGVVRHPDVGSARRDAVQAACARRVVRSIQRFCEQHSVSELARGFIHQDGDFLTDLVAGLQLRLKQITAMSDRVNGVVAQPGQARLR